MALIDTTYGVALGFTPADQTTADPDRPPLLRARPRAAAPYGDDGIEVHLCRATDWAQDETVQPDLFDFGFDMVDLAGHAELQDACAEIHRTGHISDQAATTIRSALDGAVLRGSSGRRLTVLHVADEGLIMRTAGPNRLSLVGPRSKGMNGHGPATSVHADQDIFGTPLVQIMDGRAPSLFRHDSPDGHNHNAPLMLVNLWIPLHQITQPLVLADGSSVDRLRHQARYGLATDAFLDREEDQTVNDIWTFLHHPDQRWFFRSEMDHRSAYVFNTVSTPHGATVLPGEDMAEHHYLALEAAEEALENGEMTEVVEVARVATEVGDPEGLDRTTPALRHAIADMAALLAQATADPASLRGPVGADWVARSRQARRRVVRTSIELRMVVSTDP